MQCTNLAELLIERETTPGKGVFFIEGNDQTRFLSYRQLFLLAEQALFGLQRKGARQGDELVILIEDNRNFLIAFWACLLGGIIPVPLTVGRNDEHRQKLFNIWTCLTNPYLLSSMDTLEKIASFANQNELLSTFSVLKDRHIGEAALSDSTDRGALASIKEDDIAFIQFSSGSTGLPKGVTLTHKNLLTNIRAIGNAAAYTPDDTMLSWMPLTHDMGLIGFHINPLFAGMDHYLLPPALFVRRPAIWMEKASQHRITILSSPNFGYAYLLRHCRLPSVQYDWDLSSVRLIYNGAEPVSDTVCAQFLDFLSGYKLRQESLCPVYGLAEASLAVSISSLAATVQPIWLDRHEIKDGHPIVPVTPGDNAVSFVNVGTPVDHCAIRITDSRDVSLGDNIIGEVQIRGDNVTKGYYNNTAATRHAITMDGWLKTGDLGFIRTGSLYITGRKKDILFRNGQNYYPHDLERIAEGMEGIGLNRIAVAGWTNDRLQQEEIIAFVLHRGTPDSFAPLARSLRALVNATAGIEIDVVVPVKNMPRTTSGKLQRYLLLEQYVAGDFNDTREILSVNSPEQDKTLAAHNVQRVSPPGITGKQQLLQLWKNILLQDHIGYTDDFFTVGGNSLKAAEMAMQVWQQWQVELPPETIYQNRTIDALYDSIQKLPSSKPVPIPKNGGQGVYPASKRQRRLYYSWELDKNSLAYNLPVAFHIRGSFQADRLQEILQTLIDRHDSLRTTFRLGGEVVECSTLPRAAIRLARYDWPSSAPPERLKSLVQPFDLTTAPLLRAALITLEEEGYLLFLDFHHIIADGIAIRNFVQELLDLYADIPLDPLPLQYRDFAAWEADRLSSGKIAPQKEYWLRQMNGELPALEMPRDFQRPVIFNTKGEKIPFTLDGTTTARLRKLAAMHDCSLHVLLFSLYNLLLSRYSGQQELIVGIPVAGRGYPGLQQIMGMFVNNLAIRTSIPEDELFSRYLARIKDTIRQALDNQDYPFDELITVLPQKRDAGRNPVFDTMFLYQNMGMPAPRHADFTLSSCFFDPGIAKFDLSLEIVEGTEQLTCCLEYATKLFAKDAMRTLIRRFSVLIDQAISAEDARLSQWSLLDAGEYEDLIITYNATATKKPASGRVSQLFEEMARKFPGNIAIEYQDKHMTYRELNERSDRLAAFLKRKGTGPDVLVAVLLPRSPDLIISLLGILKAGGAYLPIETDLPAERVAFLIADSQCRFIVIDTITCGHPSIGQAAQPEVIDIRTACAPAAPAGVPGTATHTGKEGNPLDLAYVLYTSGTTGTPKGVMIQHNSLTNYIVWAADQYIKEAGAVFPLWTSVSFDLTLTSIFTPLITGNTIIIYEEDEKEWVLDKIIRDNRVTVIKLTPSHLKLLKTLNSIPPPPMNRVKRFIVGGEQLEMKLAEEIDQRYQGDIGIYNEYGPTEATVGCMIHQFKKGTGLSVVPIGVPAANTRIYLLDRFLAPVPAGIPGEIYIAGEGVARGYLFKEELTREKFIPDPFVKGEKMYSTGDTGRHLPGNILEYIGRIDQQIKLNGYRIEPAEIENRLKKYEGITAAHVLVKENARGRQALYAYYTTDTAMDNDAAGDPGSSAGVSSPLAARLKDYLVAGLPYYMIPVRFIRLDHIPLTPNGKVDFDALPDPATIPAAQGPSSLYPDYAAQPGTPAMPAMGPVESTLLDVWRDMLDSPDLQTTDNFFEHGGDSIKAIQIVSRLLDKGISLTAKDILTYHTIERIGKHIALPEAMDKHDQTQRYEQGIVTGEKETTPIESWFFFQQQKNPAFYNQSVLLRLNRKINPENLAEVFRMLFLQHDGLRINYPGKTAKPFYNDRHWQEQFDLRLYDIADPAPAPAGKDSALSDATSIPSSSHTAAQGSPDSTATGDILSVSQHIKAGFRLEESRLLAAALLREDAGRDLLLITAHHLIIDAVSWRILLEDLYTAYNQLENNEAIRLPRKTASVRDWARRLHQYAGEMTREEQSYWEQTAAMKFYLPTDYETQDWAIGNQDQLSVHLDREKTASLLHLASHTYGTQVQVLLNTALALLIKEWTGQDHFLVEQESHGRLLDDIDTSRTTGWFTTLYPMKVECRDAPVHEQVRAMEEQLNKVPGRGIGYGIRKYLQPGIPASPGERTPIRFNYLGQFGKELNNDLFTYIDLPTGRESDPGNTMTAIFEFNCMIRDGAFRLEINYNRKAYRKNTVQWMADTFLDLLSTKLAVLPVRAELNDEEMKALFY